MKVFPVYMNSLMKTAPLVGSTELSTDDRAHQRLSVMAMGVEDTQLLLYPRLIPLVGNKNTLRLVISLRHTLLVSVAKPFVLFFSTT